MMDEHQGVRSRFMSSVLAYHQVRITYEAGGWRSLYALFNVQTLTMQGLTTSSTSNPIKQMQILIIDTKCSTLDFKEKTRTN